MIKNKYTKFEFQIHDHDEELFNPSDTQFNAVTVTFFHIPGHVFTHIYIALYNGEKKQKTEIDIYYYFTNFNYYFPYNIIYYFCDTTIKVS